MHTHQFKELGRCSLSQPAGPPCALSESTTRICLHLAQEIDDIRLVSLALTYENAVQRLLLTVTVTFTVPFVIFLLFI